jgi:hypothetical protein
MRTCNFNDIRRCISYLTQYSLQSSGFQPFLIVYSLVSTIEELFEIRNSGSGLENRDYGLGIRHADKVAPSIRNS